MDWWKDAWLAVKGVANEIRNEKRLNRSDNLDAELKREQIRSAQTRMNFG